MCSFKFCKGRKGCFLKGVSPCPTPCQPPWELEAVAEFEERLKLRGAGFLDQQKLLEMLELANGPTADGAPVSRKHRQVA